LNSFFLIVFTRLASVKEKKLQPPPPKKKEKEKEKEEINRNKELLWACCTIGLSLVTDCLVVCWSKGKYLN